jgi:NIMA (never in mitosis gene a)-related kinase
MAAAALAHKDTAGLLKKHGLTEIKKVGEGSFGKAILVRAQNGEQQICKMVDVSRASRKEREDAVKEAKVLKGLRHPYIVKYIENFTEEGWFCILMDFCEGGDLTKRIENAKRERKPIPEEQVLKWFTQAILALKYIHDRHILHRDLKPQNFFLAKDGTLKMGDFGIAKVLDCTLALARTQIGTPYYLSPELCKEKPYAWPSDIWAMGCILFEMCAMKVPFDGKSISQLVQNICNGRVPPAPSTYSPFVQQLITEMLAREPSKRPDCDTILQRPEIQAIVKNMAEAQDKENCVQAQVAVAAGDEKPEVVAPYAENAGAYKRGDFVEFWSNSHQCWLPSVVVNSDVAGRIQIDLKPNTWLSRDVQAVSVRPRSGHIISSACGDAPRRAPSPAISRSPSVDSRQGQRSESPRPQGRNSRANSPMVNRSPSGNFSCGQPVNARAAPLIYKKGDPIEFWSNSHGEYLPAVVIDTDAQGRIVIDLKPSTWIPKDEQDQKIRARKTVVENRIPFQRRPSSGNAGYCNSPQLPRPPINRSPSWGKLENRAPSPAGSGRAMPWECGGRAASPSGRAQRGMTPGRASSRGPPSQCGSPRAGGGVALPRPPLRVASPLRGASPLRAGGAAIAGLH